jgi:predicted RecA/RadA family phage recombinase
MYATACNKYTTVEELIGKKVMIANDKHHEGQVWEVIREGLFPDCVDIKRGGHIYLDIKIKKLILL